NFGNTDTDSVTVTVNEIPTLEISENVTLVAGESTTLIVNGAQSYQWSTGATSNTITVSPSQTTTYTVTGTTNTCSVQAQVTVIVEDVFTASAGEDERVCQNDSYQVVLTANQGDGYIWNTGETSQSITVSPLSTSTYIVTVTKGIQSDSASVTVYVDPNPNVVILNGDNVNIVEGDFITLSASGANSYQWNNGATQPNIAVSPSITTTYEVRGYVGNCYDEKQITVNVIPEVIADAGEDVSICLDEITTLIASGGDEYVWSTGETTQSIEVSPNVTTEYTVTVFNAIDFDEDTVIVNVDVNCDDGTIGDPDEEEQDFKFDIFPNPASNFVNVKLSGSDILTHVYLYDMTGKLLYSTRISNENMSNPSVTKINISMLPSGIYYIKLADIKRELTKKLVVK
ncbi:MAG: T9SS type A sorting domain-containing protein, partial [Winogradskyella sp.]|nr:T9SS type A sorting domain-containing protein [Winogradskyella sp.]